MQRAILLKEIAFKAVRSSGPGGQHVNKTSSKVELSFAINVSQALSDSEKHKLIKKLASRVSSSGILMLSCSETRSQHRNKSIVIDRFIALLEENLKALKVRKKTKPSKNVMERRLKTKKGQAKKKLNRKPPTID